ncbi:hypothetical protein [Streptomyces fructofermentans]|uniref:Uncharacterized protein n=1 Tax=Streptomyces fructofermentans TaxID=152141 RepID=A0A918NCK7_9ACTN|nr:hypothetical protein [Streptomyces fructofermentans]GGX57728.1 hypothetical protein GCM10010515_26720 [Streptomyces fructofermentans]
MSLPRLRRPAVGSRTHVLTAEAVLVQQYGDLVRLAYLVLPPSLGKHRRVLTAHSLVQRALPSDRASPTPPPLPRSSPPSALPSAPPTAEPSVPAPRGPSATSARTEADAPDRPAVPVPSGAYATGAARDELRAAVLSAALTHGRRPRGWPDRVPPPRALVPRLPVVIGLQLFPRSGGADEIVLGRALASASAVDRAAFVLRHVDGLLDPEIRGLLASAGVRAEEAGAAVRAADRLDSGTGTGTGTGAVAQCLAASDEFDACLLRARPTDLLRRRRRMRLGAVAAAVLLAATTVTLTGRDGTRSDEAGPTRTAANVTDPRDLVRTPAGAWADTGRVDFTAWPARGSRTRDGELLARALTAWSRPGDGVRVTVADATSAEAPPRPPQLLYAGDIGERATVLLYDGQRLARYGESRTPGGPRTLTVARVDDADVTTAAAVAVGTTGRSTRYLLAPWIDEAGTRDLLRPDEPTRPVDVSADGLTPPVRGTSGGGGGGGGASCDSGTVLRLRSSSRIVEKHAFLLADLGGLSPVHLTYTPLPGHGSPPPRQPREATGTAALLAWAHLACALDTHRDRGVRAVNAWDFAEQRLPDGGGRGVWTCSRASTWQGAGDVTVALRTPSTAPDTPARVAGRATSTAACGRFGQHVVSAAPWRSPAGRWYVLAAGSRAVTRITLSGDVTASRAGSTLAARAPGKPEVRVSARLTTGESLDGIG